MARLLRFAAVAVLVGGATAFLSGCTGDSDPVVSVSPSVTAEVTPSPSPSVSVSPTPTALSDEELLELIPSAARTDSFAGASEFVEFFVHLYPGLFVVDPDRRLFEALVREGCVFCESALEASIATEEANAYSEGGDFTLEAGLGEGGLNDDGFTYVGRRFSVTDTLTYLEDDSLYRTVPGGAGLVALKLKYENGAWRVFGAEFKYDDE